jgi:parallel beta-helix repeat protein
MRKRTVISFLAASVAALSLSACASTGDEENLKNTLAPWRRTTTTTAVAPATTVTTNVVSPTSTTSPTVSTCQGVTVSPGDSLASKVSGASSGTTFCLKAGTYSGGVTAKSGMSFIGEPGVILDGQSVQPDGIVGYGGTSGNNDVTVRNIKFQNFTRYAIKAGWRWTVENVEITQAGAKGLDVNTGLKLLRSYFHDLGWYAFSGSGDDMLFDGNLVERANLNFAHPGDNAAVKINGCNSVEYNGSCATLDWSERVTFVNNTFKDNKGHGIWTDGPVRDIRIEGNTVTGSWGVGIFHEVGSTNTIRGNILRNNGQGYIGQRCYDSAQILVNAAANTTVTDNDVDAAASGANGVCIIAGVRSDNGYLGGIHDISVTGNRITLSGSADNGLVGGATITNVRFDGNAYKVPSLTGAYFAWRNYPLTWSQFRTAGQEAIGTISL